jgi:hypothetical protein
MILRNRGYALTVRACRSHLNWLAKSVLGRMIVAITASSPPAGTRRQKIIVCHRGHDNDAGYTENIFEFLAASGIDHEFRHLGTPLTVDELARYQADGRSVALLGFNAQIDHAWVGQEPLVQAAARHGVTVVQWMLDHPASRWPEFGYSSPATSRFLFHSPYSQAYFEKFCCAGARTATAGSVGPNWRSRSTVEGLAAFAQRPITCLIALTMARLGVSAVETDARIEALGPAMAQALRQAIVQARFELDQPLEIHLTKALADSRLVFDGATFNRCFRLLNDSVQHFRRAHIIRTASRFGVLIQSDATARGLIGAGPSSFRQDVNTPQTLASMRLCRAVLSVSPVNDSIHDRTCNALNAGSLPILEDNRAHRGLFSHGENALLFRYDDDSVAECLALACGEPAGMYAMAERAKTMRDHSRFRFGLFGNIVSLARGPAYTE